MKYLRKLLRENKIKNKKIISQYKLYSAKHSEMLCDDSICHVYETAFFYYATKMNINNSDYIKNTKIKKKIFIDAFKEIKKEMKDFEFEEIEEESNDVCNLYSIINNVDDYRLK